jgi:type VI secretion system protein ImpB
MLYFRIIAKMFKKFLEEIMARGSFQNEVPPSRIQIKYKKHTDGAREEQELPLKLLLVGDYTQRQDDTMLEDRKKISINKNNFNEVMKAQKLKLDLPDVKSVLHDSDGEGESALPVSLEFNSLDDFRPENIARQVEPLRELLEVRNLLKDLKGRVINKPAFRSKLAEIIKDKSRIDELMSELDQIQPPTEKDED